MLAEWRKQFKEDKHTLYSDQQATVENSSSSAVSRKFLNSVLVSEVSFASFKYVICSFATDDTKFGCKRDISRDRNGNRG